MLKESIPDFYFKRRELLIKNHADAAFIFPSAQECLRNSDVHHPYRQESHFYYVSGFDEPNSCLLLLPGNKSSRKSHTFVMFVQDRDRHKELWLGERYGAQRARSVFGADEVFSYSELEKELPKLLKDVGRVFYQFNINREIDQIFHRSLQAQRNLLARGAKGLLPIFDFTPILGEMRLRKSAEELIFQKKACGISAIAHVDLMKYIKPGMNEREAQAYLDHCMIKAGCERLGYGSIVAGGENAACLHYVRNNAALKKDDLLLVDAGGEFDYYTADITRTYPVGSSFTKAQSDLYDIVLESQLKAIAVTRPGATVQHIHEITIESLVEGLLNLGLMKGSKSEIIEQKLYTRLYPHKTSHWLGMDVHDTGFYEVEGQSRRLEPGMILTIEPGLYGQLYDDLLSPEFKGIGIRIEDDILITEHGHENLTQAAVKHKKDIEELRAHI